MLGVSSHDRPAEGPVPSRRPAVHHVPRHADPAQGDAARGTSGETGGADVLRAMPRLGQTQDRGRAADRARRALPAVSVLAVPLPPLSRDVTMPDDGRAPASDAAIPDGPTLDRRRFVQFALATCGTAAPVLVGLVRLPRASAQEAAAEAAAEEGYDPTGHLYGMGIDVARCIGCGRCVAACKAENDVPADDHHFNTWIERYVIRTDGEVTVDSPNGGMDGFPALADE